MENMDGWKIWALLGVIAVGLLLGAVAATIAHPMPKNRTRRNQALSGPLHRYLDGGGDPGNAGAMAILAEAQRAHDERERRV
jgi:hypothetical protein